MAASLPGQHRCYAVDVRDRQALHAAATDFIAFCQGRVDVVIASAGISAGTLTEHGEDYDVFKAIVDTNLLATVATFEPFVGAMRDAGGGRLVGISAWPACVGCRGGRLQRVQVSGDDLLRKPEAGTGGDGIRVVTIAPGYIKTAMTAHNPIRCHS